MADKHEPWTPASIWWNEDLPSEAYERLSYGDVWRIYEPPSDLLSPPSRDRMNERIRVAIYQARWEPENFAFRVFGQWQGDKNWLEVGQFRATGRR